MEKESAFKTLMGYAGKFKVLMYISYVLSALSALLALVPFWYIWKIIAEVLENYPNFDGCVNISHYGFSALLFSLVSMLIYIGALWCSHICAFRVQRNIRTHAMEHILKLSPSFADDMGTGKVRKTVDESSEATETYLAHIFPDKAGMLFTPLGLLAMLFIFDWRLGLLSLVPVLIGFICMCGMMGKKMQEDMKNYQNSLQTMTNEAVEYVRGIPVVKTFGQSVFSFKRFKAAIDDYAKWTVSYTKKMMKPMLLFTTAINAVFAMLIGGGILLAQKNGITAELVLNVMFYVIITPIITVTMNKVMYAGENSMITADALNRIEGIMNLKPLSYSANPQVPSDNSIEFENVSFGYNDGQDVIKNLSLFVKSGEHIALVGPSGGGKSTIAGLTARFWDVGGGTIKIGGRDIRTISKETLCDTVSFVFQDSKLLKTSIYENVKMARPSATREEIEKALTEAQCDDIIAKLPSGIDTVVGADGVYLSGGEAQRISIARAMLKNAPILILDEATAFADPDNEAKVQQAFSRLCVGKTVIMIAHRLSTVVNADKIYVIKDGKTAECGTHDELMKNNGIYCDMQNEYQKSVSWKV